LEGMIRFRNNMEKEESISRAIAARTTRMFQIATLLAAIIGAVLLSQIITMRADLRLMIAQLEDTYLRFGSMANSIEVVTEQVSRIQQNVADLPVIAGEVRGIRSEMATMTPSLSAMTKDVGAVSANVRSMSSATGEMSYHFQTVDQTLRGMNYNVGHMLSPLGAMPR